MINVRSLTKAEVARRLLGTSLQLYLDDIDPVSVHTLAGAGSELTEHLARTADATPFIEHALKVNPELSKSQYYKLARQYYNAFKHAEELGRAKRDDAELMASFDDTQNDALLFIAWLDFISSGAPASIEAQVYTTWFYAKFPDKMANEKDAQIFQALYPNLGGSSRLVQKRALIVAIERARRMDEVMNDQRTDKRPLIIPAQS